VRTAGRYWQECQIALARSPANSALLAFGRKTYETLSLIPSTDVKVAERCSGHAATFGVKKAFHETAMRIGKPVFKVMAEPSPAYLASDCQLAAHPIVQGAARSSANASPSSHGI
jgi:hypothetical protein